MSKSREDQLESELAEPTEELRRTTAQLQRSRRRLIDAERIAHVGSWELDLPTGALHWSEEHFRIFGLEPRPEGPPLDVVLAMLHPDDGKRVRATIEAVLAGTSDDYPSMEVRFTRGDGQERTIHSRALVIRDGAGGGRLVGTALDITEQKQADERLALRAAQHATVAQLGLFALRNGALHALFDEAVRLVAPALALDLAEVLQARGENELELRAAFGWKEDVRRATVPGNHGSQFGYALVTKAPVIVEDLRHETRFQPARISLEAGIVSSITVLIHDAARPFGTLGAHSRVRRSFTEDDVNFLVSVSNILASAIERDRVQSELAEKRAELQTLSRRLLEAQETERRTLAREIHDELGQSLMAIRIHLQLTEPSSTAAEARLREGLALIDGVVEQVRNLALELRPSVLDDLGLMAALRWLLGRQAANGKLVGHIEGRLPAAIETCCFRVAQEALTNTAKHADADTIEIRVSARGSNVELEVCDDGSGFDVQAARERALQGASLGLLSMSERVALCGGKLEIRSDIGQGTTVHATLPCSASRPPR